MNSSSLTALRATNAAALYQVTHKAEDETFRNTADLESLKTTTENTSSAVLQQN